MSFGPGDLVVRRHFMRDDLLARVWVGRVVSDDERGLLMWIANGSAFRTIGAADGRPFREVPFARVGCDSEGAGTMRPGPGTC